MPRPRNKTKPVRVIVTINKRMERDLLTLIESGKFGQTRAEAVEAILQMFLFEREERGTLTALRVRAKQVKRRAK
jgi:Arc/MetJ-type ribon-helix-helix transcriptional regulator